VLLCGGVGGEVAECNLDDGARRQGAQHVADFVRFKGAPRARCCVVALRRLVGGVSRRRPRGSRCGRRALFILFPRLE